MRPRSRSGLQIGVIADGNGRRGIEGYSDGARNVVRCAEHCRDRGDVGLFCALLLSPENVTKRPDAFFAKMHALFLALTADVIRGRALAGVRCELYGRLDRLLRRGGAARRLAHTIELLLQAGNVAEQRARFVLGIDYDEEVAAALHLDLLVRTGMESPDVVRLSGLRPHPSTACVATTKLWCEFGPRDLDQAIDAAKLSAAAGFTAGYEASFAVGFVRALQRAEIAAPLRVVLPVAAPHAAVVAALAELERGPLAAEARLAVEYASCRGRRRFGPKGPTPQSVVLVSPGQRSSLESEAPFTALLATHQTAPVWKLADAPLGYASGHRVEATPEGLVEGVLRALRFHAEHPPLRGAERGKPSPSKHDGAEAWPRSIEDLVPIVAERPSAPVEVITRDVFGHERGGDHQRLADVFVARELGSAIARGILPADAHWKRAALNYCYTGFAIPYRVSDPSNPTGADWEPLARHVTRFMLAVAACDEEITDRVFPGETLRRRQARHAASGRFLAGALSGARGAPPAVHGAAVLAAVAAQFEQIHARFSRTSAPILFEGFRRAGVDLFRANANELSPEVTDNPLVHRLCAPDASARIERYAQRAPDCVGDRLRALFAGRESSGDLDQARRLVRLLCYLVDVAPSIGAGLTFRATALWTPGDTVTRAMALAFDRAATLIDYRFRLANDLSDLAAAADRDRDAKQNAWTILLPRRSSGRAREHALVRAAVTCEGVASWLDRELRAALDALRALWPSMAIMMGRGIHVGSLFYSMGHFGDLTRRSVAAILDDLEGRGLAAPGAAPGVARSPSAQAA